MLSSFRKSKTNIFAWALLALLVVGLIGLYGTRSGSRIAQEIASVGDEKIDVQKFYNALNQQLRLLSQQTGQNLTMSQARAFGLDRSVLAGLIGSAALDSEAGTLGISAGDETVREQILATPAFQGIDGGFDRGAYEFALDNAGTTPSEYDDVLRDGIARDLLRAGISEGLTVPNVAPHAILAYLNEERDFDWIILNKADLGADMPVPGDAELRTYFQDNADVFMLPASRKITYVKLTPDMVLDRFDSSEEELRREYEARADIFNSPEKRMLDRIVFTTVEAGDAARAEIESGSKTFEAVLAELSLTAADADMGAVTAADLDADASALVFGADGPGLVGPVTTDLGPALFRINAIIAPKQTPFEDVREALNNELALPQAFDMIAEVSSEVEDLLAGGATLEEVARETDFELETIASLTQGSTEGLAADPAFKQEAFAADTGEERDLIGLSNGGVAALRVDDIVEARLPDFTDAEAEVRADWENTQVRKLLIERAEAIQQRVAAGESLSDIAETSGLKMNVQTNVPRGGQIGGVPEEIVAEAFNLSQEGDVAAVPVHDAAAIVRLGSIRKFDTGTPDQESEIASLVRRQVAETQSDLFTYFSQAIQDREGVVVNQSLYNQVLSQFP